MVIYAKESLLFEREASNAKTFLFIFLNEALMLEWLVVVLRRLKYWVPATDTDPLVLNVFVYMCTSMEHWLCLVPLHSLSSSGFQNVCQEDFLSLLSLRN